ncbi:TetR family transcriptional regulator [Streptomyces avidinii]|uniref:TetR/AcrR family transcriptional regulator n=1 Tax=[Kitasatospora] papulosa TaxID=1464011 RepID=UPI000BCB3CC5|nr:TetR/AcrR family transcriptional regulator [[Kitasatospora] papulosa]RAS30105.1 TetR family transcriptional regulator [Streptomyces avidinii]WSI18181.1 TetR/AcrR family transcriptional regulator [[Kitasatospora] papulosa]SNX77828.1 transcriptional regulator, TetR family [Streptomyces microflavus]
MREDTTREADPGAAGGAAPKKVRADVRRNTDALLTAAAEVFLTSGVDAPVRQITAKAGVGAGTLYRHFPQRSDLIAAVFRHEVDACADAAPSLAAEYGPAEALTRWLQRLALFFATKRGLSAALHSGDSTYDSLPAYFEQRFMPALTGLIDAAAEAGEIRSDVTPDDLLVATRNLAVPEGEDDTGHTRRMIALLVDGLRYQAR